MSYGSRSPTSRTPSAGNISKTIAGLGKFNTGMHDCEVLSVAKTPVRTTLILADSTNACHTEDLEWLDPRVVAGARVRARVGVTDGFVVYRDVDRYQARNAKTGEPLTSWHPEINQTYSDALGLGYLPASTQLVELYLDGDVIIPKLYTDPTQPARVPRPTTTAPAGESAGSSGPAGD